MKRVALLRGVNVGGHNRVPMKALRGFFEEAGCVDVASHIASGNVLYRATASVQRRLPGALSRWLDAELDVRVPTVFRTLAELEAAVADNPFAERDVDPRYVHVLFLDRAPDPDVVAALDPTRFAPDELAVAGPHLYALYPNGSHGSRLSNAWVERHLAVTATARSWKTTRKLHELLVSLGG